MSNKAEFEYVTPEDFARMATPVIFDTNRVKNKVLDVQYGTLPEQKLDIYLPDEAVAPFPVIFYVHGGGWYGGGTSSKTYQGDDTNGGGGGSGFVYDDNSTEAVNSVLTQTGTAYALTDEYKLSDANTIGGHTTIPAPNGGTESGHMGHGYARISLIYP